MKENNEGNSKISESNSEQNSSNENQSQKFLSNRSSEKKSGSSKGSNINLSPQSPVEEGKKTEENMFQNAPKLENSLPLNNNSNSNSKELKESQENKNNAINSSNISTFNYLIDKLENNYKNLKGDVRSSTFQKLLNNQDISEILKELSRKNLEDIVVYILNEFSIENKNDGINGNSGINEQNEKDIFWQIKRVKFMF